MANLPFIMNLLLIIGFKIMLMKATVKYMYMNTKGIKITCLLTIISPLALLLLSAFDSRDVRRIPNWMLEIYELPTSTSHDTISGRRLALCIILILFLTSEILLEFYDWLKA